MDVHVPLEVELGRRCRGPEHGQIGNVDPECVTGEGRAGPGVDERDVMRCVPRRVEDRELAVTHRGSGRRRGAIARVRRPRAAAGSEELAHLPFTPDASRARDESGGVDEVRRAALVDPHGGDREALRRAGRRRRAWSRWMWVRTMWASSSRFDPQVIERCGDRLDGCSGAGLDEGRFGGVQEVGGGVASPARP